MARTDKEIEEYFEVVNQKGEIVGTAPRSVCHGNPDLIHRVIHVLVFNDAGQILLQKRALSKDIQPGKWDTSVGGHLAAGETFEQAACREMEEELSIRNVPIHYLYDYLFRTSVETEMVKTFTCCFNGPIFSNADEIAEARFWDLDHLLSQIDTDIFTPNLREELHRYLTWKKLNNRSRKKE
ncbi:MAG: NUDIX domain-containing protein [bacterium]